MEHTFVRVAIADDHPVIRLGLQASIEDVPSYLFIGAARNADELLALLDTQTVDVAVTDYAMPGSRHGDGLELVDLLRDRHPNVAIIVMTAIDKPAVIQALLARGVDGILSKADDVSHVVPAVQAASVKRRYLSPTIADMQKAQPRLRTDAKLSPREREVLSLYVSGKSINEIAALLQRRKQTVSSQKVSAMAKLGIENDAELFQHAAEIAALPPVDEG